MAIKNLTLKNTFQAIQIEDTSIDGSTQYLAKSGLYELNEATVSMIEELKSFIGTGEVKHIPSTQEFVINGSTVGFGSWLLKNPISGEITCVSDSFVLESYDVAE